MTMNKRIQPRHPLLLAALVILPLATNSYDYSNYNAETDYYAEAAAEEEEEEEEEVATAQLIYAGGASCSSSSGAEHLELLDISVDCESVNETTGNLTWGKWCTVGDGASMTFTATFNATKGIPYRNITTDAKVCNSKKCALLYTYSYVQKTYYYVNQDAQQYYLDYYDENGNYKYNYAQQQAQDNSGYDNNNDQSSFEYYYSGRQNNQYTGNGGQASQSYYQNQGNNHYYYSSSYTNQYQSNQVNNGNRNNYQYAATPEQAAQLAAQGISYYYYEPSNYQQYVDKTINVNGTSIQRTKYQQFDICNYVLDDENSTFWYNDTDYDTLKELYGYGSDCNTTHAVQQKIDATCKYLNQQYSYNHFYYGDVYQDMCYFDEYKQGYLPLYPNASIGLYDLSATVQLPHGTSNLITYPWYYAGSKEFSVKVHIAPTSSKDKKSFSGFYCNIPLSYTAPSSSKWQKWFKGGSQRATGRGSAYMYRHSMSSLVVVAVLLVVVMVVVGRRKQRLVCCRRQAVVESSTDDGIQLPTTNFVRALDETQWSVDVDDI